MTINSQAITIAKQLLGIDNSDISQDDLLVSLGNIAETDALTYTNNESILFEYYILARMIQYNFNQRGNEGLLSQTVATVSETYSSGTTSYPQSILTALRGFRKLKAL